MNRRTTSNRSAIPYRPAPFRHVHDAAIQDAVDAKRDFSRVHIPTVYVKGEFIFRNFPDPNTEERGDQ